MNILLKNTKTHNKSKSMNKHVFIFLHSITRILIRNRAYIFVLFTGNSSSSWRIKFHWRVFGEYQDTLYFLRIVFINSNWSIELFEWCSHELDALLTSSHTLLSLSLFDLPACWSMLKREKKEIGTHQTMRIEIKIFFLSLWKPE